MLRISNMVTEILTSEDTVRVVDGLSLTLNRGEICALVGESGCCLFYTSPSPRD